MILINRQLSNGQRVDVLAEPTNSPDLAIAPTLGPEQLAVRWTGGFDIVHVPTGLALPGRWLSLYQLRMTVERIAHLDWSSADPTTYKQGDYATQVHAAIRQVELIEPEPIPEDDPSRIPEAATPLISYLLRSYARLEAALWPASSAKVDPPVKPINPTDPRWPLAVKANVDRYGLIYCLAALQRVDPAAANSVAAMLARAWESGDALAEWTWQWRKELDAGEPLTLHGVPSPEPKGVFADAPGGDR